MTADGVVSVPRLWPRILVDRLRASEDLVCAEEDVVGTSLRECAAFTARALSRAFVADQRVEEIFLSTDGLTELLVAIWSNETPAR